jgi:DNA-binding GntR family transcriptional regulator
MGSADSQLSSVQAKTLHGRLTEDFIHRIRSGEWPVGSALPSEKELCEQTQVSRHTLRHTLQTLQNRGLIDRRQGAASRVISCTPPKVYSQDFNTLRDVLRYPSNTYRENLIERHIECDAQLIDTLRSPIGSSWYQIGAVRRDQQSNLALAWTDIFILNKFARVVKLKNHAHEMVYEQIERHFGVGIEQAEIEILSATLSREHAKLLDVPTDAPCLVIIRRYYDSKGEPFEVTVTRHPEKRFTFKMELKSVSRSTN